MTAFCPALKPFAPSAILLSGANLRAWSGVPVSIIPTSLHLAILSSNACDRHGSPRYRRIFGGRVPAMAGVEIMPEDEFRGETTSLQITLIAQDLLPGFNLADSLNVDLLTEYYFRE